MEERTDLWAIIEKWEYIINVFVFGVPWAIIGAALISGNIFFNVTANRWWAGGNILLLLNTVYGLVHYILSLLLVFEVDLFIRYMKIIRLAVLSQIIVQFFVILLFLARFLTLSFGVFDEDTDAFSLIEVMFLGYNLLLYIPIFIIDSVIVIKEVTMEYF